MVAGRIEIAGLCAVLAAGWAWAAGARRPSRIWVSAMASSAVISILLNLYLVDGQPLPLPVVGGRSATLDGLLAGVLVTLRLSGALIARAGLRRLWSGDEAAERVAAWLGPLERVGVPIRSLRELVRLAVRMQPAVGAEHRRIRTLQGMRAGRPARGLPERVQRERAVLIPTFVATVERADRLALALEARHHRQRPVRSGARFHPAGVLVGLAVVAVACFVRS
jgi:energy-coupling factor transporter transmembrane protein EcfT